MFNIVLMLVITIDAAFLTIILSEMIYVVKKLPTLVFWGKFFWVPIPVNWYHFWLEYSPDMFFICKLQYTFFRYTF